MGKFEEYYEVCEQLYVNEGYTLTQINKETGVSLTTLTKWKDAGDWEERRKEYLKQNQSIKDKLLKLKHKLVDEALIDGDPQKVYALTWLIRSDKAVGGEQKPGDISSNEELSPETLRKIKEEIYGILENQNAQASN